MTGMSSFTHPSLPSSPMAQQRDLTPPSLYQCHMSLRGPIPPPGSSFGSGGNIGVGSLNNSVNICGNNLQNGSAGASNYEPLSLSHAAAAGYSHHHSVGLAPPPPHHSTSTPENSALSGSTQARESPISPHQGISGGGGGVSAGGNTTSYTQIGLHGTQLNPHHHHHHSGYAAAVAAASNNGTVSGAAGVGVSGTTAGKQQQFFASCFYSPWV